MEEEGLTASGTPRTILEDKLGGLASQFPTVPQLVSSFVARNGLPEPTSIVSRSRGVSAGLVSVCSRSDNGDYHFLVDASDLSFSSNSIGTGRVRDYVLEGTIFGDNLVLT
ncbi:MAG TPA: hypothetical protein VJG49_03735, partial [Candidatus Nanoarchaeia archaeon]|nr:hypothetical protein [Candidatus Nanoarchaeia archaeon]